MRSHTAPWIIARGHSSRGSSRQGRGAALRRRVRRALRWTGRHSFYATARRARRRPGRRNLDPSVEERSRVVTRRVEPTERHTGDRQPDAPRAVAGLVSIRLPVAGRRLRRVPGRALRHCVACAAGRRVVRRSACRPGDAHRARLPAVLPRVRAPFDHGKARPQRQTEGESLGPAAGVDHDGIVDPSLVRPCLGPVNSGRGPRARTAGRG